jgi:hypothetical protein
MAVLSMLAESHRRKSASPRHLRQAEMALITKMVSGKPLEAAVLDRLEHALVEDMDDGGMGSIRFQNTRKGKRCFGRQIGEATFVDADGILVSATLNADQHDDLFELDLWKVDDSKLRRYPTPNGISVLDDDR